MDYTRVSSEQELTVLRNVQKTLEIKIKNQYTIANSCLLIYQLLNSLWEP